MVLLNHLSLIDLSLALYTLTRICQVVVCIFLSYP